MSKAVEVRNVTKTYAEGAAVVQALSGVDFHVDRGELVILMGPSGSGKTTLLSIMGCILRATSGRVEIEGVDVTVLSERELPRLRLEKIGFIFQGFNLFPALTASENVALALDLKGIRASIGRLRAEELLAQVGLGDKFDAHPADLSGGQKQRVAIARALAADPAIILADEPTAALDFASGRTVMDLLHSLARKSGRAVVLVSHDSRILQYADRIVRIEDGRIVPEPAGDPDRTARSGNRVSFSETIVPALSTSAQTTVAPE